MITSNDTVFASVGLHPLALGISIYAAWMNGSNAINTFTGMYRTSHMHAFPGYRHIITTINLGHLPSTIVAVISLARRS